MSLGTIPASTAALLAPTAAPSLSARSYSMVKLSPVFMPEREGGLVRNLSISFNYRTSSSTDNNLGAGKIRSVTLAEFLNNHH